MSRPIDATVSVVEQALTECSSSVRRVSATSWSLALSNGAALPASASLDDGWVSIGLGLGRENATDGTDDLHKALRLGSSIPGRGRAVIAPGTRHVSLLAEFPVRKNVDLARRVVNTCAELERAADLLRGSEKTEALPGDAPRAKREVDIPGLCEQAGWPCTVRSSGRQTVDLEATGGFFQAEIHTYGPSGLIARARLADWESLEPLCRDAVDVFLLSASGRMKAVRPSVRESDGRITAFLEVAVPEEPQAGDMNDALGILSVACSVCGREAACLADEFVAGLYLAARGWDQTPRT